MDLTSATTTTLRVTFLGPSFALDSIVVTQRQ